MSSPECRYQARKRAKNRAAGLTKDGKKRLLDCPRRYWTDEMIDDLDRKALADPEVRRGRA